MKFFRRRDPEIEEDLVKLEAHLRTALQPVSIRPEFVRDLQARLVSGDLPPVQRRFPMRLSNILLVAGGVLGSMMVLIAGIRGLISLGFMISQVIQRTARNNQRQQATPA